MLLGQPCFLLWQCDELGGWGKGCGVVCLHFSKALDTLSRSVFLEKLATHGLDRLSVHGVTNLPWFPSPESGDELIYIQLVADHHWLPSVGANPVLHFYHSLDEGIDECTLNKFADDSRWVGMLISWRAGMLCSGMWTAQKTGCGLSQRSEL